MRLHFAALSLALSLFSVCALAGGRTERTINDGWDFHKEGEYSTTVVNIPHSWNAEDCTDDTPGYWRGIGWYQKKIYINEDLTFRKVYMKFEGANQVTELFVNGNSAGVHVGGYSAFVFDITHYVRQGINEFRIKVDNSHNVNVPPLHADFTFFGGIYRDISLIITNNSHISTTHYGSSGVSICTPSVAEDKATVHITTRLTLQPSKKYSLHHTIMSPGGMRIADVSEPIIFVKTATDNYKVEKEVTIKNPRLWDFDTPRLYTVVTELIDSRGNTVDMQRDIFGIRTFSFDSEKGFFLNGRHVKLIGTNRHQDYRDMANAIPDEMHIRDLRLLKEMGGNFLRISHYPQDPIVTQMTDRLGILASVEIPIIDEITLTPEFRKNCVNMIREMVWQNYNNPSVIVWAYMNEVLIRNPWTYKSNKFTKEHYFEEVCATARAIEDAINEADTLRPTMIPIHDAGPKYKESGLMEIPDIVGVNLYCGWYKKDFAAFGPTLQEMHELFPGKPLFLSEYGADQDSRLHSFNAEKFDYTSEYGFQFHQAHIPVIQQTEFLSGATVWNLCDFHSEVRGFAVPHINLKGLTTRERTPKDTYWLYKAVLGSDPFVRICDHDWTVRGGAQNARKPYCKQPVNVISNAERVYLLHNGQSLGGKFTKGCVATFDVCFTDGENTFEASATNGTFDLMKVNFKLTPADAGNIDELNVMLGSNRYFEDKKNGIVWIPEQKYFSGSWGYTGGQALRPSLGKNGTRPAMEGNVYGTDIDPVFQTQRVGIEQFRADVSNGRFYVYLYFAETTISPNGFKIPYSLGEDTEVARTEERVFDVKINGNTVLKNFNIAKEYGPNRAAILKFTVDVNNSRGIRIDFEGIKDKPVLNAVRIYRCY